MDDRGSGIESRRISNKEQGISNIEEAASFELRAARFELRVDSRSPKLAANSFFMHIP